MAVFISLMIVIFGVIAIVRMIKHHSDRTDGHDSLDLPTLNPRATPVENWRPEEARDPQEIATRISQLEQEFEDELWIRYSVAGESRANADGTGRQSILHRLRRRLESSDDIESRSIQLAREPRNKHDANAIRVSCIYGQVGYMTREDAWNLAPWMDARKPLYARVDKLLGGDAERPSIGIWIRLSTFADFGEAREAKERAAAEAEASEARARRLAEKDAKQEAKRAERAAVAETKRQEREATAEAKRQEREASKAAKRKSSPTPTDNSAPDQ
jgi:hypothetical protein